LNGGLIVHWEKIEEKWQHFKGMAKEKWPKLSDADLDATGGNREQLIKKLQESYHMSRDQAEVELKEFSYDPKH
jgi:uncharacterized protein YjbJ (UPF0337 family)